MALKPIAPPSLVAKYVIAGARAAATRLVDRKSRARLPSAFDRHDRRRARPPAPSPCRRRRCCLQ